MTDDELAMAYADGELDEITARRFERRMADAPDLAAAVEAHRALRARLRNAFDPLAEAPLPERLTGLLQSNVVALEARPRASGIWRSAAAMAACLVAGIALGQLGQAPADGVSGGPLLASDALARSLDETLSGRPGAIRVLVSFRNGAGDYCRLFQAPALDGLACREARGWAVKSVQARAAGKAGEYRQAGSPAARLMDSAQEMMAGEPLDQAAERAAQARHWRP